MNFQLLAETITQSHQRSSHLISIEIRVTKCGVLNHILSKAIKPKLLNWLLLIPVKISGVIIDVVDLYTTFHNHNRT